PLTLIMGPIEDALSKITDQSVKRLLRTASDNGRRLLQLINQLLNLSTLEADRMELKANRGDLISFLRGIVDTFESVAAQRQITISFQTDYDQLAAYFDKE
ncbi:MAG: autoinducer kinase, partial [Aliifodinibius sp.]|nr:autoinducer kinase [candidate division Zixibacteria bacterium]NIT58585.1 autoinducer kinase [Fodinibius sp.]NIV07182.1 autoinducer kinase [candidate division Zixibacteria bacterium]NIY27168.1 autoinducer kinase [Fodinibius sp.]